MEFPKRTFQFLDLNLRFGRANGTTGANQTDTGAFCSPHRGLECLSVIFIVR
jgi:hypothetical protein